MNITRFMCLVALGASIVSCKQTDIESNQPGSVELSGLAKEGETLSATVTDADGFAESAVAYRWLVGGAPIEGASSASYTLTVNEAGKQVYVSVTYVDNKGFRESHVSTPTAEVEALPVNTAGEVRINGSPTVGQTLMAEIIDANGVSGTVNYSWSADGVAISSATTDSLTLTTDNLGQVITVSVSYTDDDGFAESVTSAPTTPVASDQINTEAQLTLVDSDKITVGTPVVANLLDPNGTSNASFVWTADDVVIAGANSSNYTPVAADLGKTLAVSVDYVDDDGYSESVSVTAQGIVHSTVVNGLSGLITALQSAASGDIIGLADGDYNSSNAPANQIKITADGLRLVKTVNSNANLSGNICLDVASDNVVIDGLSFSDINILSGSSCESNGLSSIYLHGNAIQFINNSVSNEAAAHGLSEFSWISVKGFSNTLSRNLFTDASGQKVLTKGAVITIYNNSTVDDQEAHTISYNLFKDFGPGGTDSSRNSSAYMIQVGRSTGSSSQEDGLNRVEYNLFKNVNLDRRYMRVQSGKNVINGNTFLDGSGMVALEDGNQNTVSNNIFINTIGDNPDDGGISYGPYGHTIENNYIAGLRTTSGDRGGIFANSDVVDGSGNMTATPATVIVRNNTLINNREAIEFASKECQDPQNPVLFLVDFDDNLVANGETGTNTGNEANGVGREAIQDDCGIDTNSDFDNNHIYSSVYTNSGTDFFAQFTGASGNVVGAEGGADLTADTNGLWKGQNTDANIGADTSKLHLISESDVGPGSTTQY